MNESQSVFLDALRFVAALLVVFHHFLQLGVVGPGLAPWVPDVGHESVLAFFVLSGFVIRYVGTRREDTPRDYTVARAARIYSVALPIVLFAMALDGVSTLLGAEHVEGDAAVRTYQYAKPWLYLPLNLAFLGQSWTLTETPLSVLPYWSLCYEVAYYVGYAVLAFARGWKRALGVALVVLAFGPKIALLAPAWALGVLVFDLRERGGPLRRKGVARVAFAAALAGVLFARASNLHGVAAERAHAWLGGPTRFTETLLGNSEGFLYDWGVALLFALAIAAFPHTGFGFAPRAARTIRWLASFTFTLYLVHVPVILFARRHVTHDPDSAWQTGLLLATVLLVTFLVGSVSEHRKRAFGALFERLVPGTADGSRSMR